MTSLALFGQVQARFMKLYHIPGSCSLSPHIVIRELDLPVELVRVDHRRHTTESGDDFLAVNPLGYAPVLELADGTRLSEGPAIVQFLADQKPEAGLAPGQGTFARYTLQQRLNFIGTEIHKGFIPLLYPVAAGTYVDAVRPKLMARFEYVDGLVKEAPYLLGDTFTVADAYLFAITRWGKAEWMTSVYNADIDLSALPHLRDWFVRVLDRPAVQVALAMEATTRSQ